MKKKVLWLVPARSGSKSIPHKNIKLLGDYPLLAYRIQSAIHSSHSNDLWISTDSDEYAQVAKEFGAEVPFIRPLNLSTDDASSIDVVLHAMEFAKSAGRSYEFIGLLEPTSPFISVAQLDDAVLKLENEDQAQSIVAVRNNRPNKIFVQDDSKFLSALASQLDELKKMDRQAFLDEITPSGGFYISDWDSFLENKTFYTPFTLSYKVDEICGLEIDESIDWLFANFVIEKKLVEVNKLFGNNE